MPFDISSIVLRVVETLGEPGAGLLIAIENLFPPIPSELILPLVGYGASQGQLNLFLAIFWTTVGSVVGALALYYVGALLGRERTRNIVVRLPLVKVSDFDKTEAWFLKYETKTVFYGRMLPIFRSLISIPAGIERMKMSTFIVLTAAGSLIWNTALIGAGYLFGENLALIEAYVGYLQKLVILVTLAGIAYFVVRRLKKRRTRKNKV